MDRLSRKQNRSLYRDITIALVLLVIIVSFVAMIITFWALDRNARIDYERNSFEFIAFLKNSLITPVWDVNYEGIDRICTAFSKNEIIAELKVTDHKGRILYEKTNRGDPIWARRKADIRFKGDIIGRIELGLTPKSYQKASHQLMVTNLLTMTLVAMSLVAGIWLIARKILKEQLDRLLERTQKISKGEYDSVRASAPYPEIQEVLDGFDLMTESIRNRENQLAAANRRLAMHFENTPLGVIEWDLEFRVVAWNKAAEKIFGYTREEALDRVGPDLIVPEKNRARVKKVWDVLISGKGGLLSTGENITKNGEIRISNWYNTILYDEGNHAIGAASFILDVTEHKRLEFQLRQAQKMEAIGTLAGGIAHDFNNILSPMLGFAELLQEDLPEDSPLQENINEIITASLRAKELVKQILAFGRLGKQEVKPIHLQPILKETVKLLKASIPKTIRIQSDIDPGCGAVLADATEIHQIAMNLATNAYHAMQEKGGQLKISLHQREIESRPLGFSELLPGRYALLEVTDTGTGIEKSILDKVYDPYFTTKKMDEGTGLGLSVAQGIVRKCKGEIHIYSEPGKGTRIHVYLPIAVTVSDIQSKPSQKQIKGGIENILLVDDEVSVVRMEKQALVRLGYHVSEKSSGKEALEVFKADPDRFDLVITDMTMPEMTGLQLAREIKMVKPTVPVIISTGFSNLIDEKNMGEEIDGYVSKPASREDFARIIRDVLDK